MYCAKNTSKSEAGLILESFKCHMTPPEVTDGMQNLRISVIWGREDKEISLYQKLSHIIKRIKISNPFGLYWFLWQIRIIGQLTFD